MICHDAFNLLIPIQLATYINTQKNAGFESRVWVSYPNPDPNLWNPECPYKLIPYKFVPTKMVPTEIVPTKIKTSQIYIDQNSYRIQKEVIQKNANLLTISC